MATRKPTQRTPEQRKEILDYAEANGPKAAIEKFKISGPGFYTMRKKARSGVSKKATVELNTHPHTSQATEVKLYVVNKLFEFLLKD